MNETKELRQVAVRLKFNGQIFSALEAYETLLNNEGNPEDYFAAQAIRSRLVVDTSDVQVPF